MDKGHRAAEIDKASEIELLQACIAHLEKIQKDKKYVDVRRKDNIPTQNRLVKLIGSKPLFNCLLNGVETQVLWDTGSMVSLLNSSKFP